MLDRASLIYILADESGQNTVNLFVVTLLIIYFKRKNRVGRRSLARVYRFHRCLFAGGRIHHDQNVFRPTIRRRLSSDELSDQGGIAHCA
jgi:hypothetical protein